MINIPLPETIIAECIDAGVIQKTGSLGSVEGRSQHVQRLTYHIGEYVISKVEQIIRSKRLK